MSATPNERDTLRADNEWLQARVAELERDRDEWRQSAETGWKAGHDFAVAQEMPTQHDLRARINALEQALRWFLNLHGHSAGDGCEWCDRYRAVLDRAEDLSANWTDYSFEHAAEDFPESHG